ncbi:hypothetical protein I5Q34_09365 [Streptomyces sp. AV19]|uniref:hypothetical protein n=1 Tax=Streptomyces sp. AV19 TaxID=2793068 RepID=UPI0018FEE9F0|nr:hypothetical protein [Streptomyces sp. AV19]MBH1934492.1 hypothetical protein [Streptomyces sp. AV19]MDG4533286.1 hypothetical protein [Streptomyces sp. AV19]
MIRISVVLLTIVLTGAAVVGRALGDARIPVTLPVAEGGGECVMAWSKPGVSFVPLTPGTNPSSYAFPKVSGTVEVDLAYATDPVNLAASIRAALAADGGFSLTDASGHSLQVSDPQVSLPSGESTFLVKTSADPSGTRMSIYVPSTPPSLVPEVSTALLPKLKVGVPATKVNATQDFADALNSAFGPGSASAGAWFATCSGSLSS